MSALWNVFRALFVGRAALLADATTGEPIGLRGARQFNDRKVLVASAVADVQFESNAVSASNAGPRRSARRSPRPFPPGFEARRQASRNKTVVDLVRSLSFERLIRTIHVGTRSRTATARAEIARGGRGPRRVAYIRS